MIYIFFILFKSFMFFGLIVHFLFLLLPQTPTSSFCIVFSSVCRSLDLPGWPHLFRHLTCVNDSCVTLSGVRLPSTVVHARVYQL